MAYSKGKVNLKDILIIFLLIIIFIQGFLLLRLLPKKPKVIKALPTRSKVAIVIDDWGYNLNNIAILERIGKPITLSILPNLTYSKKVAEEAKAEGLEVILHLPLEPENKNLRLEQDTITTDMPNNLVEEKLKALLNSVPYIVGVSNHMGSKAMKDTHLMEVILKTLKKEGLFFLDSLVTSKSVAADISKKIRLQYIRRDVFLDIPTGDYKDQFDYVKIRQQLFKLANIAIKRGSAIGIGHDKEITLSAIKDIVPVFKEKGIDFVFVSEVLK